MRAFTLAGLLLAASPLAGAPASAEPGGPVPGAPPGGAAGPIPTGGGSSKATTDARMPPERPSDEGDRRQLELARQEGAAYQRELDYMVEKVAHSGGRRRAGDYVVAYAQEEAEGMYAPRDGGLEWVEPGDENCHLEISVSDAGDQRFVPGLKVVATLSAKDGQQVGPFEVPFLWHPGLYHYGKNVKVPGSGVYTLRVRIEPPTFMRHDKVNGRRYADAVEVEFADVDIKAGRE